MNCALSLCGYDDKNLSTYHPTRRRIRKSLKMKSFDGKEKLCRVFNEVPYWLVEKYIFRFSKPPEFNLKDLPDPDNLYEVEKDSLKHLKKLSDPLRKFYRSAEIHNTWLDNQEAYKKEVKAAERSINRYKPIEKLENFLRTDLKIDKVIPTVELMEARYRGIPCPSKDELHVVMGPTGEDNTYFYSSNTFHEALHPLITREIGKYQDLVQKSSHLKEQVPEKTQAHGYGSWRLILEETIVRTATYHCLHKPNDTMDQESLKEMGFVHVPTISKEIEEYRRTDKTFKEYLPEILESLAEK